MTKLPRLYQVKELAQIANVSVRTLHHYDEIGLLRPSQRSASGYRKYDQGDVLRLQQILIQRELGLPLEEIRRCLDDPGFDQRRALLAQREQLRTRARHTAGMLQAVERALAALDPRKTEDEMDCSTVLIPPSTRPRSSNAGARAKRSGNPRAAPRAIPARIGSASPPNKPPCTRKPGPCSRRASRPTASALAPSPSGIER